MEVIKKVKSKKNFLTKVKRISSRPQNQTNLDSCFFIASSCQSTLQISTFHLFFVNFRSVRQNKALLMSLGEN